MVCHTLDSDVLIGSPGLELQQQNKSQIASCTDACLANQLFERAQGTKPVEDDMISSLFLGVGVGSWDVLGILSVNELVDAKVSFTISTKNCENIKYDRRIYEMIYGWIHSSIGRASYR